MFNCKNCLSEIEISDARCEQFSSTEFEVSVTCDNCDTLNYVFVSYDDIVSQE